VGGEVLISPRQLGSVSGLANLVQIGGVLKWVDNPEVINQELYDWVASLNATPSNVADEIEWPGQVKSRPLVFLFD